MVLLWRRWKAYTGIHTINGKQYYFDRYGWLYKNGIIRDNDKTYYCDEEGIATDVTGGGWVQKDGNWLYIKDGVFSDKLCRKNW